MRCELLGVNRVYVDNLGPTSIEETLLKFWWNLYIYIYIKKKITRKKFPMYREIGCGKSGLLHLLSYLDQAVEQQFLTSSARQIIISAATAEQLIDQLQSFILVIDPSMSRINWSTTESRKKLKLDLSLRL